MIPVIEGSVTTVEREGVGKTASFGWARFIGSRIYQVCLIRHSNFRRKIQIGMTGWGVRMRCGWGRK